MAFCCHPYNISLHENLRCKQQTCTWYLRSQRQSIEYIPFSKLHRRHLFLHQVPHQFHQLSAKTKLITSEEPLFKTWKGKTHQTLGFGIRHDRVHLYHIKNFWLHCRCRAIVTSINLQKRYLEAAALLHF